MLSSERPSSLDTPAPQNFRRQTSVLPLLVASSPDLIVG
tara:strand:+ start:381 stop:497 length:117 start_codon:yes stop_codon:yes gene_type:complete